MIWNNVLTLDRQKIFDLFLNHFDFTKWMVNFTKEVPWISTKDIKMTDRRKFLYPNEYHNKCLKHDRSFIKIIRK